MAIDTHWRNRFWLLGSVLVVVTFVAYQSVWHAGFIWDDDDHLTANPAMTAPHGLQMIWSSLDVSRYYPLTLTSFWVQRRLWGLNPLPYHWVNIALHAINGILVYSVLRRLRVPAAWLAAMLWTLHPINVESVAWITELKNTQSGLFFFLALLCFFHFEASAKRRWYALAIVCGLAAMLSKPSTVVLPLVLLLCAWWKRGGWRRVDMVRIAPFFGLALGMSALTVIEQRAEILEAGVTEWKLGIAERFVVAGKVIWFYAAKLLWPAKLAFIYPRWEIQANSFLAWLPLATLVAGSALLWVWRRQPWSRAGLFALGYFVAVLLPVLGFFDVYYFRYSFVADHFQYLASVGLIALAASACIRICGRTGRFGRHLGPVAISATLIALGVLTWRRGCAYRDMETLWRDTLATNPSCSLAHNNLGLLLAGEGKLQEAIWHGEQVVRLKPDDAEARNNLGVALAQAGRDPEAIAQFESALRVKPGSAEMRNNLGLALSQAGRIQDAIGQYEQAMQIKPDYAEAHNNLGAALVRLGKVQEAIGHWEQALRVNPDFAKAQSNLAWVLATLAPARGGDPVRAVALAQQACELTGNRVATYVDTLGVACAAAGRFNEAIAAAQKAIELARAEGQAQLVGEIEARLQLYREGRAYRQSADVTSPHDP